MSTNTDPGFCFRHRHHFDRCSDCINDPPGHYGDEALHARVTELEATLSAVKGEASFHKDRTIFLEARVAELEKHLAEANERERDLLETILGEGHFVQEGEFKGWWDSMALSHIRDAGDRLVELGTWERHPDGYGRRWFYRRMAQEARGNGR